MNKIIVSRTSAACMVLVLMLGVVLAPAAYATKLKRQNLTQLIADSHSIVAGTVSRVTDGIASNGMPYTEVTIMVGSVAKGDVVQESEYTFRQFGLIKPRRMENGKTLLAVSPAGFPRWREGEFAVAFLYRPAAKTGLQTTAGLAQGKLSLVNGQLVNEFNNEGLFDGVEVNENLTNEAERNMLTGQAGVNAAGFMELVGRAVSERWIETGRMK